MPRLVGHPGPDPPPGGEAHDREQQGSDQRGHEPLGPRHEVHQPGPHPREPAARGIQRGDDVPEHAERRRDPREPVPGDHPVEPGAPFQPRGPGGEDQPAQRGEGGQEPGELADRQRRVDAPGEQCAEPTGQHPEPHRHGDDPRSPGGRIDPGPACGVGGLRVGALRPMRPRGGGSRGLGPPVGTRGLPGSGSQVVGTPRGGAGRRLEGRCHASMLASRQRLREGRNAPRGRPLRASYVRVNWRCSPYRTTIQLSPNGYVRPDRRQPLPRPCAAADGPGSRADRCPRGRGSGSAAARR